MKKTAQQIAVGVLYKLAGPYTGRDEYGNMYDPVSGQSFGPQTDPTKSVSMGETVAPGYVNRAQQQSVQGQQSYNNYHPDQRINPDYQAEQPENPYQKAVVQGAPGREQSIYR